jgi:hypothetical protein
MFCTATTPTLARAWAHRAATAGDEEETAIANIPVVGQRAAMEKVIGVQSGITAVASTSTTHSGRARAEMTSPVDTGNTPFK